MNEYIENEASDDLSETMTEIAKIDTQNVFDLNYTDKKLNELTKEVKRIIGLSWGYESFQKLNYIITDILSNIENKDIVEAVAYIPLYGNSIGSRWSPYRIRVWGSEPTINIKFNISEKQYMGITQFAELANQLYIEKYPSKRRLVFSNYLTNESKEIYQKAYELARKHGILTDEFEPDFSKDVFALIYKVKLK